MRYTVSQSRSGEVKAASEANQKSAQALNNAAESLNEAASEATTALASATNNLNSVSQQLDSVAVPETIDVSFSPVNVVGTDQFATALEPTLTRIVEQSVARVIAQSLNEQYDGPPLGANFDQNLA